MMGAVRVAVGILMIFAGIVVFTNAVSGPDAPTCAAINRAIAQTGVGTHCSSSPSWAGLIGAIVCLVVGLVVLFAGRRRLPRRFH